jgi:hypothetical protein
MMDEGDTTITIKFQLLLVVVVVANIQFTSNVKIHLNPQTTWMKFIS